SFSQARGHIGRHGLAPARLPAVRRRGGVAAGRRRARTAVGHGAGHVGRRLLIRTALHPAARGFRLGRSPTVPSHARPRDSRPAPVRLRARGGPRGRPAAGRTARRGFTRSARRVSPHPIRPARTAGHHAYAPRAPFSRETWISACAHSAMPRLIAGRFAFQKTGNISTIPTMGSLAAFPARAEGGAGGAHRAAACPPNTEGRTP